MTLKYKWSLEEISVQNKIGELEKVVLKVSFTLYLMDEKYNSVSTPIIVDLRPPNPENFTNFESLDENMLLSFLFMELGEKKIENIKNELQENYNNTYIYNTKVENIRMPEF